MELVSSQLDLVPDSSNADIVTETEPLLTLIDEDLDSCLGASIGYPDFRFFVDSPFCFQMSHDRFLRNPCQFITCNPRIILTVF
jgi:hypothetical protein